ncbi:hypothetical protein BJX65DRAFT_315666 [Aspergillus insuetus]
MNTQSNSRDSMKSTWRRQHKSQWTIWHTILDSLGVHHVDLDKEVPVHQKDEKIPYMPDWSVHRWIIFYTGTTLALHELYIRVTGSNVGPVVAYLFYYWASRISSTREICSLRELGHKYGFLDGDKYERDGVPDADVQKTLTSIFLAGIMRPLFIVYLTYYTTRSPSTINFILLPFQISIYGIIIDFWFYWYHRLMHEVDGLWKYHRRHHLTKHPNPLLTIYADHGQGIFDIAVIPLMAFFTMKASGFPMGFYEWYVCSQYIMFAEIAGHSGLRIHAASPSPLTFLLRVFDAELVIEDHDLHHRRGWKSSYNYGKQTRLWDKVFGTTGKRIESAEDNVDYKQTVLMPLF